MFKHLLKVVKEGFDNDDNIDQIIEEIRKVQEEVKVLHELNKQKRKLILRKLKESLGLDPDDEYYFSIAPHYARELTGWKDPNNWVNLREDEIIINKYYTVELTTKNIKLVIQGIKKALEDEKEKNIKQLEVLDIVLDKFKDI